MTCNAVDAIKCLSQVAELPTGQVAYFYEPGNGRKPHILLIHGNSSSKEIFAHLIPLLKKSGHGVLALDLPGHGDSVNASDLEATYSFPGYARVVGDLLTFLDCKRIILIGWSLGGHVAVEVAARQPEYLGLMMIGAPPGLPSHETFEAAFFTNDDTLLAGKCNFSEQDTKTYASQMYGGHENDFFLERVRRTDGRARQYMFNSALAGVGLDQSKFVEQATKLIAILVGRDEPFVRADYLNALPFGRLWRNEVQIIDGAGHAPHWECPSIFNAIALDFIEDCTESNCVNPNRQEASKRAKLATKGLML